MSPLSALSVRSFPCAPSPRRHAGLPTAAIAAVLGEARAGRSSGLPAPRRQRGQAMTEYIVIVALIAVAAIAVYQLFGQVVRAQTAAMARELAGEDGTAQARKAQGAAAKAVDQAKSRSLKAYTGNAAAGK